MFICRSLIALAMLCCLAVAGCGFGPRLLRADQVDYGRALGDAKKREILSIVVGLRFADSPGLVNVTQIIASYTFDASTSATVNANPDPGGPRAGATGMATYSNRPTFTFTPTTGESYAKAYIRPLSPAQILPLAESGVPIDLLLRIAVQSVNTLSNVTMLGSSEGNGSPAFFELLAVLRRLQLAGQLGIHYALNSNSEDVVVSLGGATKSTSSDVRRDLARARELLHLPDDRNDYPIISEAQPRLPGRITVVTRSMLAILSDLSAEIDVPAAEIQSGATKASIPLVGGETRPVMVVHAGKAPGSAYASVRYRAQNYWIDDSDFDSKYALTVVQELMALAEVTDTSRAPIVTVPAQ
jgi:hypothetical protein